MNPNFVFTEEIADALAENRPVVSMESTLIAQGLPYPQSVEVVNLMESALREQGVTPATIAIIKGRVHIGLDESQLEWFATQDAADLMRCSRRNMPLVIAQKASGSTTVAGTMIVSHLAGIPIMATGGLGGVHRAAPFDVSADLLELSRTPVTVVASGVKPFLDLPATKEVLETHGVLTIGFDTDDMAPFYDRHSGVYVDIKVECEADTTDDHAEISQKVATIIDTSRQLEMGSGQLVTVPVAEVHRSNYETLEAIFETAVMELHENGVHGPDVTTWMVKRIISELGVKSVLGNVDLLNNNAIIAAKIASCLASD